MNAEMNNLLMRVETRVRQLILKHRELQAEKKRLEEKITALHQEINSLEEKNRLLQRQYDHLKMAKYIDMADSSTKDLRGQIRKMVRDIDQCVALLKAE
ncbi:MAG: hypothetical protein MSA10_05345 [Paraprevotella sp.]|nr:hypothetical protein [Bacteroidaceae bacterium]MCI6373019.1 hypothetical protein [Paraprevotella sp.]MCI6743945.1 hypothetical protein [Paraprevotella sp.]MCI7082402.1 hypothetical protein [Paraprevotella sp.]MCI7142418.1 hypothetical protein [Paraprevotella sp.]